MRQDACTDPDCYQTKVDAHVVKTLAASRSWYKSPLPTANQPKGARQSRATNILRSSRKNRRTIGSATGRNTRPANPPPRPSSRKARRKANSKICADPNCPVHHPKKQKPATDAHGKAEQEKQRREEALAQATGLRVLNAIIAAVPVRLMKRDLLFLVERVATMLDERRLEIVARNRGIKKAKDSDSIPKLLSAYIRKAEEGELGRLLMEMVILHAARTQSDGGKVLKEAAEYYKVDTDAIGLKVKQDFTAKQKAQAARKVSPKAQPKSAKKSTAA